MGEIEFLLFPDEAPVSVKNFKEYVQSGFYNGCIFHRVIPDFMIQGGGYTANLQRKQTRAPIVNEAPNGLKNLRGTLAYARTDEINSATSQFFINLVDNVDLDHKNTTTDGYGYAVFGKVVRGMDVVDKIAAVKTGASDIPEEAIVIKSAELIRENP
jgi:cyclophilin family peptidyl-prolyl cis-trans isomerase